MLAGGLRRRPALMSVLVSNDERDGPAAMAGPESVDVIVSRLAEGKQRLEGRCSRCCMRLRSVRWEACWPGVARRPPLSSSCRRTTAKKADDVVRTTTRRAWRRGADARTDAAARAVERPAGRGLPGGNLLSSSCRRKKAKKPTDAVARRLGALPAVVASIRCRGPCGRTTCWPGVARRQPSSSSCRRKKAKKGAAREAALRLTKVSRRVPDSRRVRAAGGETRCVSNTPPQKIRNR